MCYAKMKVTGHVALAMPLNFNFDVITLLTRSPCACIRVLESLRLVITWRKKKGPVRQSSVQLPRVSSWTLVILFLSKANHLVQMCYKAVIANLVQLSLPRIATRLTVVS